MSIDRASVEKLREQMQGRLVWSTNRLMGDPECEGTAPTPCTQMTLSFFTKAYLERKPEPRMWMKLHSWAKAISRSRHPLRRMAAMLMAYRWRMVQANARAFLEPSWMLFLKMS